MITTNALLHLESILEKSPFGLHNFEIERAKPSQFEHRGDLEYQFLLTIIYLQDKKYNFSLFRLDRDNYMNRERGVPSEYFAEFAPSEFLFTKIGQELGTMEAAFMAIDKWTSTIYKELRLANPLIDEFHIFKAEILASLEDTNSRLDAMFSENETSRLKTALDELLRRVEESEALTKKNSVDLDGLRDTIESLKASSSTFTKRVWYKSAVSKLIGGIKKVATTKEGREFALEAAKQILLPGRGV